MLIQIKNIFKTYQALGIKVKAVDDISMDIPEGSFVTITGPSGSGKTTLLLILGGLLRPTSGSMVYRKNSIDMQNENAMASIRAKKIGFVMQSFALVPYLDAVENVILSMSLVDGTRNSKREKAIELLTWVGLSDRCSHYPRELSSGQQQRVAIARAMANSPELILADEPTGNLDPQLSEDILKIFKKINEVTRTTIVMVTHSSSAAENGNLRIKIEKGKIVTYSKNFIS